jgi:protein-histidine pros-kinase
MSLRLKFNLVMFITLAIGIAMSYVVSKQILEDNAKEEVLLNADIMMQMAKGIRGYTVDEVKPVVLQGGHEAFIKQTVPSYAATRNFDRLREKFPEYTYQEATINPTNPVHRATDWEKGIIDYFAANPGEDTYSGVKETATGNMLYLSHPFRITNPKCLACHSTPAEAPPSMLEVYGRDNGFGWELNSVVGAQIVYVPMSLPLERADKALQFFMISLTAIFIFIWLLLNILLHFVVIKPVKKMAEQANVISKGQIEVPEFDVKGKDEISSMAESFNRMHRSLASAVKMIRQQKRAKK